MVATRRAPVAALADRVALLDGGRIAAIGTHAELLAAGGVYRAALDGLAPAAAAGR
ncbi:hypothetical protein D3C83_233800 [compost metagenome]